MRKKYIECGKIMLPVNCLHYKRVTVSPKVGKSFQIYVPCGKCYRCRKKIAAEWSFRLKNQADGNFCYNLLFTYSDDKLPIYKGKPCLNRVQLSDAFKRIRYYIDEIYGVRVKFFAVGEYSPENKRPHYHVIMFSPINLSEFDKLDILAQCIRDYCWTHGFVYLTQFDNAKDVGKMVGYMCTYMLTSLSEEMQKDKYIRPFRIMSKGLGEHIPNEEVIKENCSKRLDWTYPVTLPNGKTQNVSYPRYYLKKWLTETEQDYRTDKFIAYCDDFYNYLQERDIFIYYDSYKKRLRGSTADPKIHDYYIKSYRRIENELEFDNYRKRKVHSNNRKTGGVFEVHPK